ncbi:MAG: hypothetical protein KME45_18710 [Stenomitos rutilans HA7619-LM2]|nr:hypothetical protein [Stenomitos rutilans HA7619-LM2]
MAGCRPPPARARSHGLVDWLQQPQPAASLGRLALRRRLAMEAAALAVPLERRALARRLPGVSHCALALAKRTTPDPLPDHRQSATLLASRRYATTLPSSTARRARPS